MMYDAAQTAGWVDSESTQRFGTALPYGAAIQRGIPKVAALTTEFAEAARILIHGAGQDVPEALDERLATIETILAEPVATAKPANGTTPAHGSAPEGGTLAERIRALQSHASRARQQGA